MRRREAVLAALPWLAACSPSTPWRLGLLAGITGRTADLGAAAHHGARLAVDDINAAGGVAGRPLALHVADDAQNADTARQAVRRLAGEGVIAVVGPVTSGMAEAILPDINAAALVTVSPSATTTLLSGQDDFFLRACPSIGDFVAVQVRDDHRRGARRVAIVLDLSNQAYSSDWARRYAEVAGRLGMAVVVQATMRSGDDASYLQATAAVLAARPDHVLLICSAVDTARLVQSLRNGGLGAARWSTSSWGGTESLIQLGGATVEGVRTPQYFDRDDRSPAYLAFASRYRERFAEPPGFASVSAYDAVQALAHGLARAGTGAAALKRALLEGGPYIGLQESWRFDAFGDSRRKLRVAEVIHGRFQVVG
ncbi:ABC transporter substrate-binding protein [Roseateles sp. LKC17W]|uniref:ABC transporter substrate-binding protein n=1 Tax=Pelomonas margarita TaxID=3299031 RepID=A0ABW7FBN5_9BURK